MKKLKLTFGRKLMQTLSKVSSIFDLSSLIEESTVVNEYQIITKATLEHEKTCPKCGSCHLRRTTKNSRLLHLPPVGKKKCQLEVMVQKRHCINCNSKWWPQLPFAEGKERMTLSFKLYALDLLKFGTIQDVAKHLGVSWDVVKGIHKNYLLKKYEKVDLANIEHLSIDEFSIAKGHRYMTIFVDLCTGRIVHAVEGRKKKEIQPFLEEVKKKAQI